GDILVIHTGYHQYYPENWADGRRRVDESRYFLRHPGPTRDFADWVLDRGVRWLAVDAGSADHPMHAGIRRLRADDAAKAEAKLGAIRVRVRTMVLGTGVTNVLTRHESVLASAVASLDQMSPGRTILGLGTGDSAVRMVGLRPARLDILQQRITRLRSLLRGEA